MENLEGYVYKTYDKGEAKIQKVSKKSISLVKLFFGHSSNKNN